MNAYNNSHDLEADLISSDDYENSPGYRDTLQNDEFQNGSSRNRSADFEGDLSYSSKYNILRLVISLTKVIATSIILTVTDYCMGSKSIWLILMAIHDAINCFVTILTLNLISKINSMISLRSADQQRNGEAQSGNQSNGAEQSTFNNPPSQGQQETFLRDTPYENQAEFEPNEHATNEHHVSANIRMIMIARDLAKRQKLIVRISGTLNTFYFLLFFIGQILYFTSIPGLFDSDSDPDPEPDCESTPQIDSLMISYIILGYLWLLAPVIFVLLACLCLPVLLFFLYCFGGKSNQVGANKRLINSIPVVKYSQSLPGSNECSICMVEYNLGDDVAKLKCSPMHHFHADCIKQWLKINGQCPICRKRLEEM